MYIIRNGETVYDSGSNNKFVIKVRGNTTAEHPKKPYKLKLPKKANLLSDASSENKDKNWVLLANYTDKSLLRTKIGFYISSLFNEIAGNENLYVPHSEFVDVILNNEYIGNYLLTDSIKEGAGRLNVNEKETDTGGIGFIAERDPWYFLEDRFFFTNKGFPYSFKFPDTDEINFDSYLSYLQDYLNRFETSLYESESAEWINYIDIESFARWFLICNIVADKDPNYFFSKISSDDSSKIIMGPLWDMDWTIGIIYPGNKRANNVDYWCGNANEWYFDELVKKEAFASECKRQWNLLQNKYPNVAETIIGKMSEFTDLISISREMNLKLWYPTTSSQNLMLETEKDKKFLKEHIDWLASSVQNLPATLTWD
jgi:spore coat protein CotH